MATAFANESSGMVMFRPALATGLKEGVEDSSWFILSRPGCRAQVESLACWNRPIGFP
ncbi:hypothetical protein BX257_1351 [Streptomyces sp. 3212.3]|nr:hypothetical protein BX257_1351 [Streptomyces sp. 3212.3]